MRSDPERESDVTLSQYLEALSSSVNGRVRPLACCPDSSRFMTGWPRVINDALEPLQALSPKRLELHMKKLFMSIINRPWPGNHHQLRSRRTQSLKSKAFLLMGRFFFFFFLLASSGLFIDLSIIVQSPSRRLLM